MGDLDNACSSVVAELGEPRHLHFGQGGWYSISVLASLFDMTSPCTAVLSSIPAQFDTYSEILHDDEKMGILINQWNEHLGVHVQARWAYVLRRQLLSPDDRRCEQVPGDLDGASHELRRVAQ